MGKEKFKRNKPHVNVGTIGNVDHGKTTLTAALPRAHAEVLVGEMVAFDGIDNPAEEWYKGKGNYWAQRLASWLCGYRVG